MHKHQVIQWHQNIKEESRKHNMYQLNIVAGNTIEWTRNLQNKVSWAVKPCTSMRSRNENKAFFLLDNTPNTVF